MVAPAHEIVSGPLPIRKADAHISRKPKNDGDDRWVVEQRQYARRKPNEDAATMLRA
jgi:hypothetical protein